MNLRILISRYLPLELVKEKKDVLFETLVTLLGREGVSKDPIVDQIFSFMANEENMRTALGWLEQSKISVNDQHLYELKPMHKQTILKVVFKSTAFSQEQKMDLLDLTLGEDKSDLSENCRVSCMASLPDPEVKAKIWQEITDMESKHSLYTLQAKMGAFYAHDQMDLTAPYEEKFFDVLYEYHEKSTFKQFNAFFYTLLPLRVIKDSYVVRLISTLNDTPDTEQMFSETVRDGIDMLIKSRQIREFAQSDSQPKL